MAQATEHFKRYAVPEASWSNVWFSYNKQPLRWNVPVGVLFDLECGSEEQSPAPWRIRLHVRNFPAELLPFEGQRSFHSNYMHSLKEATCILRQSPEVILKLSTEEQLSLENSRDNHSYSEHCAFSQNVLLPSPNRLPLRIYSKYFLSLPRNPFLFLQDCVAYKPEQTIRDVLEEVLPGLKEQPGAFDMMRILLAGVPVFLDTPVSFLYSNFLFLDHFIYLTLVF